MPRLDLVFLCSVSLSLTHHHAAEQLHVVPRVKAIQLIFMHFINRNASKVMKLLFFVDCISIEFYEVKFFFYVHSLSYSLTHTNEAHCIRKVSENSFLH
jgi:hypothetical protein